MELPVKRATLTDVAADACVSRATASLVLRESPLVAEATRERVLASMRKLGYVYNRAAATLRAQHSRTIGLAVTDITNPFFAELAVSIEGRLESAAYAVLLTHTGDQLAKQERLLNVLHGYQVDGLVFCPAQETPLDTVAQLRQWNLPFVLVARYLPDSGADYVGADNRLGAEMAVDHLVALGHRRIAFVGGPVSSSARRDRLSGYREALERHRLPVDDRLARSGPASRDGGFEAARSLLQLSVPPTAALCYNDVVAFGALLGLQAEGRTPGRDFAVVGFDNIADAALVRPALTTVAIDPSLVGQTAVEVLLDRMAHPERPVRQVVIPPHLDVRESSGPSA
jgi:LacI family transcriptional regulator